jgi:hypothetical protein
MRRFPRPSLAARGDVGTAACPHRQRQHVPAPAPASFLIRSPLCLARHVQHVCLMADWLLVLNGAGLMLCVGIVAVTGVAALLFHRW